MSAHPVHDSIFHCIASFALLRGPYVNGRAINTPERARQLWAQLARENYLNLKYLYGSREDWDLEDDALDPPETFVPIRTPDVLTVYQMLQYLDYQCSDRPGYDLGLFDTLKTACVRALPDYPSELWGHDLVRIVEQLNPNR
jgi:hypothetical protein